MAIRISIGQDAGSRNSELTTAMASIAPIIAPAGTFSFLKMRPPAILMTINTRITMTLRPSENQGMEIMFKHTREYQIGSIYEYA
jgi:hypothetical protein